MKILCHCEAVIVDSSDGLAHKAHVVPDQAWFGLLDALDEQVIDALADGRISREAVYQLVQTLISEAARHAWQCRHCGRIFVDNRTEWPQCYRPEDDGTSREVFRQW